MQFGVMFFSSVVENNSNGDRYSLLKRAARFADERGFRSIWTPERHFHEFGGLYPNPAVTSAALAMMTERLEIRAGSLISPLHDVVRIAEDWAVVDNLSNGRAGISFGSGWNADDFIFFPERYTERHKIMYEQIDIVRRLWRGESVTRHNSFGKAIEIKISPRPVQPELPVWITSSGNIETFASAGTIGANVLTHLLGQDLADLAAKIGRYRSERAAHGFDPKAGVVSLMLHTLITPTREKALATGRGPLREYLRSAIALERKAALGGGVISGSHRLTSDEISTLDIEQLLDIAFERYFDNASLMGSPTDLHPRVWRLKEAGVDEIACLVDIGVDDDAVLESLELVDGLRASFSQEFSVRSAIASLSEFTQPIEG